MKSPTSPLLAALLFASLATAPAQTVNPFVNLAGLPATLSGASDPGALTQGTDGKFYGMEKYGGPHGGGTIYAVQSGQCIALHVFTATDPDGDNIDGQSPEGSLIQAGDGNFYGVTSRGGAHGGGTFFKMTPAGALTVLHDFIRDGGGDYPVGGLLLAGDGNFYGNTITGGVNAAGSVLKLTPAGVVTDVLVFDGAPGSPVSPGAALAQDADGNFYGTSERGGAHDGGTVFRLTPGGVLTVLRSFNALDGNGHNRGGTDPQSALVRGRDGNFYGTTRYGGTHGGGVVYKVTPAGNFSTLHNFDPDNAADGYKPFAALVLGKDGYFYGTTEFGGASGTGTIFQIKGSGVETVLHSFSAPDLNGANPDGASPLAALVQGKDNNLYGTTSAGGPAYANGYSFGTVFSFDAGPVIDSELTAAGTLGQPFSYQITATDTPPARYGALNLFAGLKVDPATGLISGTPMLSPNSNPRYKIITRPVTIKVTNYRGTSTATLGLAMTLPPPVITSPASADATVGQAFSYQITAANYTYYFYVSGGLPPGLSFNNHSATISGTPTKAGTYTPTISGTNAAGSGSATLTITVAPQ